MMQNDEPIPMLPFNEAVQNPTYINTDLISSDQPSVTSAANKPPKKQKRLPKIVLKKSDELIDQQQNSSGNNINSNVHPQLYQNGAIIFNEQKIPEFRPFQYFNGQAMPPPIPFHNPYNQYLPPPPFVTFGTATTTSYPYNQFPPQRDVPRYPAMQNLMQMANGMFHRNHQPLQSPTELYHQQPLFGLPSELEQPQLNTNMSQLYSQSRAWLDSQAMKRRHFDSGAVSAFSENCKKPRRESVSTLSNCTDGSSSNYSPYSSQSNDVKEETVLSGNRIDDKKLLDSANVIEEKFDFSCVICQETKKDTVLLPCRHLCVCEKCCGSIVVCPLCRKTVNETMTVFT